MCFLFNSLIVKTLLKRGLCQCDDDYLRISVQGTTFTNTSIFTRRNIKLSKSNENIIRLLRCFKKKLNDLKEIDQDNI